MPIPDFQSITLPLLEYLGDKKEHTTQESVESLAKHFKLSETEKKEKLPSGYLCLLVHPDKPGVIKIGLTYNTLEQCYERYFWEDWEVHRHRFVEEPVLAETFIWELLGQPLPNDREPIKIDLSVAEQAFRDLIPQIHREIALAEKKKEDVQKTDSK